MSSRKLPAASFSKPAKKTPSGPSSTHLKSSYNHHDSFNPNLQNKSIVGPNNLQKDQTGRIAEFFSKSDVCPVCKSDRYLNPNLRLLVAKCYHKMCESCIDRIFSLGPEPCPICGQTLRKNNFAPQTFENLFVEKEVVIRKRISKYFNKRREDFKTLDDYNNYLEEVEDITFNLINGVDVAQTEAKIKQFQIDNQDLIAQNAVYEARQIELNKRQEEALKKDREERKAEFLRLEEEARREEQELKNATIRSLEISDVSAEKLVARQKEISQKKAAARALASDLATKSSLVMPSLGGLIDPTANQSESANKPDIDAELAQWDDYSNMFDLQRLSEDYQPGYRDDDSIGFIMADNALALVGGFEIETVWERQLRSALMGLFVPPPEVGYINQTTSDDLTLLE
ncbi:hypothetical protein O181_040430 [Austropuccinia psidii MF-1]|uniref:RNA polymerase II transcription factor B subunit 3 n=1 Tax=Austropuccinia psidii MF-1 TaxID=1389203 RepID=A0A9Q3DD57_9BASI|nr:hypothetical protein [Austropuccinia psidii MF-1]